MVLFIVSMKSYTDVNVNASKAEGHLSLRKQQSKGGAAELR